MNWPMPVEAIVLAGGLGTRLRPVISDAPKPMAPVHGRPFLEYLMDYWIGQGVQRFILSVGYLGEQIEAHFGNVYRGLDVSYIREKSPLGTGGGIRQALINTEWRQPHAVIVNGDTWYEVNLPQLVEDAKKTAQPVTITLKPMKYNDRYGAVNVDAGGHVSEFGIKTDSSCLINGGCYLVDVDVLKNDLRDYPERFSMEQDYLVQLAKEGRVAASIQAATFLDIGMPDDYALAPNVLGKKALA